MADTTELPNEMWVKIVSFLDDHDLAKFRQICKATQLVGSDAYILQPLYNRLYALDKTLPALLPQDNAFIAFKEAFLKILTRQEKELMYLITHHPDLTCAIWHPGFVPNSQITLAWLEVRDEAIDKINSELIIPRINVNGTHLILSDLRINRLPASLFQTERYVKFWKNLRHLNCTGNDLMSLDVQELVALEKLQCDFNPLLTTLNVQGLAKLRKLECKATSLTHLNLQGLAALQYLDCHWEHLIDLNLTGVVHEEIKNKYGKLEKWLLWTQLETVNSTTEQQRIIARLGKDFTYANCLYYAPIFAAKTLASNILSQVSRYLPSFTSTASAVEDMDEEYKINKRARPEEEGDARTDDFKRMKREG